MIKIPTQNQWRQSNVSDVLGTLYATFGIDLTTNKGVLRISPRMLLNVNSTTLANLGVPCAFRFFTIPAAKYIWAVAGSRVFNSAGGPDTVFAQDATGSSPTDCNSNQSDMEVFDGNLYVTRAATSTSYLDPSGAWNSFSCGTSSGLKDLEVFAKRMYMTNNNATEIISWNTSRTIATVGNSYALDLTDGDSQIITFIKATSSRIWIGTLRFDGSQGYVYAWDGQQQSINEAYRLQSVGALSGVVKDDVLHIMDADGRLLAFNGGTFVELDRLPLGNDIFQSYFGVASNRFVHYNGMTLVDGRINILVNGELWNSDGSTKDNLASGIWEYDPSNGLYLKQVIGLSVPATTSDYGQAQISVVGALQQMNVPSGNFAAGGTNGRLLAGATYFSNATSTLNGIFYNDTNDTKEKAGYFVTSKIMANDVETSWNKIYARFKKFLDTDNRLIIKWRSDDPEPTIATITWTGVNSDGKTTFSTTDDISDYVKGDEVEVIQGTGGGVCAHITSIQTVSGVTYCDLDETAQNVSGTAKIRLQKWKKLSTYTGTSQFVEHTITEQSPWIQFKVCYVATGTAEIYDLLLVNKTHQPAS